MARVLSAEFRDDRSANGRVDPDETILLRLDRPLPETVPTGKIVVRARPPAGRWAPVVRRTGDPRQLEVVVASGAPEFRFEGVLGRDPEASGLEVDLGDGVWQRVDLQRHRTVPLLVSAVLLDGPGSAANGAVDGGDRLRLRFDAPVRLAPGVEGRRVRVPGDILLTKDSIDRLDDGTEHAVWVSSPEVDAVDIVLGAQPVLEPSGEIAPDPAAVDRSSASAPSGIALNGTRVAPLRRIVARRGGAGAASAGEVDIGLPPGHPRPLPRPSERFPSPGGRSFATVTPLAGVYAAVVGGKANDAGRILDDVLVYSVFHERLDLGAFTELEPLPGPSMHHRATWLPGASGDPLEGYVVVSGGWDGERAVDRLTVIRIDTEVEGGFSVETLDAALQVPRWGHRAVAVDEDTLLVDGGRTLRDGQEWLVGAAELLHFRRGSPRGGDGREPTVVEHRLLHSFPRRDHSLTTLETGSGPPWVLAYGGFGHALLRPDVELGARVEEPESCLYPVTGARVLSQPVLLRPTATPDRELALPVDTEFRFPWLRRLHRAVPLGDGVPGPGLSSPAVLIAGGTLAHPGLGYSPDHRRTRLWQIPPRTALTTPRRPSAQDAAHAVLFLLDPSFPEESRLELVEHPTPHLAGPRVHGTATPVPGLGVVLAGGASAQDGDPLDSLELFLPERRALRPWATRLAAPRARHGELLAEIEGSRSLILIGGRGPEENEDLADVEEVSLPAPVD